MKTFKDADGRDWRININVATVKRLRDELNVNLAEINEPREGNEAPLLTELSIDVLLLAEVLFALVKRQANEYGLDDESLAEAWRGDVHRKAIEAFWGALSDFFLQTGRKDLALATRRAKDAITSAINLMEKGIEAIDLDAVIADQFSGIATSSQGSAESTQAATPSAN